MKRYVYAAAALLLLWTGVPQAGAVDCSAISAVVMEAETGRVLYENGAFFVGEPAQDIYRAVDAAFAAMRARL